MLTGGLAIFAVAAFVALALAFVVARRALRVFVKLALVALLALLLLGGYVWWRWQGSTTREPTRNERRQSAPARR
jgi:membrane protein implicated in regulation of membrane protease activity